MWILVPIRLNTQKNSERKWVGGREAEKKVGEWQKGSGRVAEKKESG
jgi:hypothetical protein